MSDGESKSSAFDITVSPVSADDAIAADMQSEIIRFFTDCIVIFLLDFIVYILLKKYFSIELELVTNN